jgi:hypothetical protein
MKFAGIDPKTGFEKYELSNVIDPLNPEEARYLSQDLTNNLFHDLNRSTIVAKDKTFDVMGGYSQFLSPDKKSIMYRDIWDLQPLKSKLKGKGKIAEKIGEFEVSSLIPGAKPFVSEGKIADVKTKYYPTSPYKNINQRFSDHFSHMLDVYDPDYLVDIKDFDNPTPEEISKYYKIIESLAKKNLHKEIKEGKSFLNDSPRYRDSKKYADISPYLKVQSNKKLKKKNGGIVEDDMGYWNPDNHGKPVRVNSNVITMEGVYEPLLGISDTGDTKLMKPGKNYKFKGKKVTEFPVAQYGKGVPFKAATNESKDQLYNIGKHLQIPIKPKESFEEKKRIAKLELDQLGYTSDQRKAYAKGKSEKAFNNIVPAGYGDLEQTLDRLERYQKNLGRNPNETLWYSAEESSTGKPIHYNLPKRDDAFSMYLGMPQKNNSFGISEYQPVDSKENKYYFKPNYLDENLKNALVSDYFNKKVNNKDSKVIMNERNSFFRQKRDSLQKAGIPWEDPINAEWYADNPLGDFKVSEGKDEKGQYLSIYDVWDLNPFKVGKGSSTNPAASALKAFAKLRGIDADNDSEISEIFGAGKPFEIYDRIYYDPKTKKVIPQKRNGGSMGINQLDAQPMKKLNQLTNFTNNPDKTNWLDKYN